MRRFAPILTLLLVVTACSDSSDTDPAAATSTPAGPSTAVPATLPPADATTTTTPVAVSTTAAPEGTTPSTTTARPAPSPLADLDLQLVEVTDGFRQPVLATAPPGDDRIFVVDQPGTIGLLRNGERAGTFLDITSIVSFGGEQGLLGLAFHPGFPSDPRFYVHYSALDGSGILAEYRVGELPDAADPDSGRILLRVPQPASNHNGGMIAFGPDGLLYMALGDGGAADDRFGNGQNTETLLGSIIRIDIDAGEPYAIPETNPFAAGGGAAEIWGYGLRNPWRFSFDGDLLFIGDVGQNTWEEINIIDHRITGANFGWPIVEGFHCFAREECDQTGLVTPVIEYTHDNGACSVTGGYVYRGRAIPELDGAYFYGDFCSGLITSFRLDGDGISEIREWPDLTAGGLTSFGTDGAGEVYVVTAGGTLYRIERA